MKDYEKIRSEVSKRFKDEIQQLKLEILKLQNENTDLQAENLALKKDIQKYKNKLENISDSQKRLFGLTETINNLHLI